MTSQNSNNSNSQDQNKDSSNKKNSNTQQPAKQQMPKSQLPLYLRFPHNSQFELTITPNDEKIIGTIYCTDEISQTVVITKPLHHTTLSVELRVIQVSCITNEKIIETNNKAKGTENGNNDSDNAIQFKPLPTLQKKVLEDRERKAVRMAEESFRHINQNASEKGQAVFDRLLKACNEVVWKGESILVLNQIQVDPPYGSDECKLMKGINTTTSGDGSLDRVRKIVASAVIAT